MILFWRNKRNCVSLQRQSHYYVFTMNNHMKKIIKLMILVALALPTSVLAETNRPKLVVGLMVDQMRWDYLYYYYDQYQRDGLRRLLDEGYSFENCMISYVPTVTAIGHTSVYTGSVPALHGICGNNFFENGREMYCCDDSTVVGVGSDSKAGKMSPRNNYASTIGDQLKIATDYKAKVIGVALKDRASILPAGHIADAAYWWDKSVGHFISSTYYMKELPQWVRQTNDMLKVKPGTEVLATTMGIVKTFDMARAALKGEQMGMDDITDLLAVSVSSTDAIGHDYGTRGPENSAAYMELDKQVAAFLSTLDQQVGKGNYLVFLTADHGGAHNPNVMRQHKMPAGGLEMDTWLAQADSEVSESIGFTGKLILGNNAGRIYLDHKAIAKQGKSLDEVKQLIIAAIEKKPEIMRVVDQENVLTTSLPQLLRERIANGYNRDRSGDLYYIARPNWEDVSNAPDYRGTTHAMWNPYDSHIPFLLYGWNVQHGETSRPVHIVDIAPTICHMLHIQMPNACIGNAQEM